LKNSIGSGYGILIHGSIYSGGKSGPHIAVNAVSVKKKREYKHENK
jgi:hypothetical protein